MIGDSQVGSSERGVQGPGCVQLGMDGTSMASDTNGNREHKSKDERDGLKMEWLRLLREHERDLFHASCRRHGLECAESVAETVDKLERELTKRTT